MTAAEFIAAFAEESKSYNIFEHHELIKAVKGCDEALKSTFFPKNETLPCPDSCSELAVKLVCYTITKITDYGFNKCLIIQSAFTIRNGRGPEFYFYACHTFVVVKVAGPR